MTDYEERVWTYLLENRRATNKEVAAATDLAEEFVAACVAKIGTPEQIWRNGGEIPKDAERVKLLREASSLTAGDRNRDYGEPVANMQHIADIFNAWTGLSLTARQVAQVHIATKMARRTTSPKHRDSYVDDMAYTGIEYECAISNDN